MATASDPSDLRRSVYLLLAAVAVAVAVAKVVGAENVVEPSRYKAPAAGGYGREPDRAWPADRPDPSPMFSSNDKSRWATVRALVEDRTYAIGKRKYPDARNPKAYADAGIVAEPQYKSLDVVLRPLDPAAPPGAAEAEFYSSKPPLFATLLAAEYWLLKEVFGWSIVADRWLVIPAILLTVNVLPFAVYLGLLSTLIEATGKTDFGRLLAFAVACFGTFLTTFSGTLNNHLPAAYCVLFATYPLLRAAAENRDMTPQGYAACGFFAGFATTFDLPAAAFLAGVGVPLLAARPRQAVLFFVPAAAVPVAALFACNYAAMGTFRLPYSEFGGPWYTFEGSHWAKLQLPTRPRGIDFADEPKDVYAFHLLLGHHGWFSLTPVWFAAAVGLVMAGARGAADVRKMVAGGRGPAWTGPLFAGMTLVVSAVVIGFYVSQTNNYGGFTSGPRWLIWLTPLWVLALPPVADRLAATPVGRFGAAVLLGLSALSVFYPGWNPWRPPWLLQWMEFTGRVHY